MTRFSYRALCPGRLRRAPGPGHDSEGLAAAAGPGSGSRRGRRGLLRLTGSLQGLQVPSHKLWHRRLTGPDSPGGEGGARLASFKKRRPLLRAFDKTQNSKE